MSELWDLLHASADRVFENAIHAHSSGLDADRWACIEDAGLDRLLLSPERGGAGDAFQEAIDLARLFGARACRVPLIETLMAHRWLDAAGYSVPEGPKTIAIPHVMAHVPWADEGVLIVLADGDLLSIDNGLRTTASRTNLAGEPLLRAGAAMLDDLPVPKPRELALYVMLKAAAIVGALEACLNLTLAYVNERVQFGRRIGTFPAVQHMVVRLAEECAAAAAAVQRAAPLLGSERALHSAAVAKSRSSEAAETVSAMAHQCHGAMGITQDYPLWQYSLRALAWRDDAGSEDYWNARIGAAALAHSETGLWLHLLAGGPL